MLIEGAATCCPCLPERHERPSASERPPKPTRARNPASVETAAGSSTTVYRPGSRAIGDCDATALSAARRPIAAGSTSAALLANVSANPLPRSPPVATLVIQACEEGVQQNCPSVFATATSEASVSKAPAAVKPAGTCPTSAAT